MNEEKLQIKSELPVLSFNEADLKTWATSLVERFDKLVVTEDTITATKKDMAEISKNKELLNRARIDTIKKLSIPLKVFETKIKNICGIFDDTYSFLSNQIKVFEEKQRDEKRALIILWIEKERKNNNANSPIPIQERWFLKTVKERQIRHDIVGFINTHKEQEKQRIAIETAKQERIAIIEQTVKSKNESTGLNEPLSVFMSTHNTCIDTPIADVFAYIAVIFDVRVNTIRLEKERLEAVDMTMPDIKEEEPKPAPIMAKMNMNALEKAIDKSDDEPYVPPHDNMVTWTIKLTFTRDKSEKVKNTLSWLEKSGIKIEIK